MTRLLLALLVTGTLAGAVLGCATGGGAPDGEVAPPATAAPAGDASTAPAGDGASGAEAGAEPTPGVFVDDLDLVVSKSFPVQVRAELRGHLADTCVELGEASVERTGVTFEITLAATRAEGRMCAQMLVPFRRGVELEVIDVPKGTYHVTAHGRRASFTLYSDNTPASRMR